jgi:hypothetical protein
MADETDSLDLSTEMGQISLASRILKRKYNTDGVIRPGEPKPETLKLFSHIAVNDSEIPFFFDIQKQVALHHDDPNKNKQ